jgi:hypothetical protein
MEFEEIRKIWDTQNSKPLYVMNDAVLYRQVVDRQRKTRHITQVSELLLIIVNVGAATFILGTTLRGAMNISLMVLAVWLGLCGAWVLSARLRRLRGAHNFDRSLHGEMNHALSIANHQIRLARMGRWNALPVGALTLLALWESGKGGWWLAALVLLFTIAYVAAGWETNIYIERRNELEAFSKKFDELPG